MLHFFSSVSNSLYVLFSDKQCWSDATWTGPTQSELPQQTAGPHPRYAWQRATAGKAAVPPPLFSPLPCSLTVSLALCTHPVCISPWLEMECACRSKPSSSPLFCPSLSASVCGGGLALRQSGHTDGGPAETKQHGENQKHNYTHMHAHTQDHVTLQTQDFTT